MQQSLQKPTHLALAESYHIKSVHAGWDGKKAESQHYGRLCAEQYILALDEEMSEEDKVLLYWKAVLQHDEVRRFKTAIGLSLSALELIKENESLLKYKFMFDGYVHG